MGTATGLGQRVVFTAKMELEAFSPLQGPDVHYLKRRSGKKED